jgi:Fe-S cluster assembly iron-binding protein IscA
MVPDTEKGQIVWFCFLYVQIKKSGYLRIVMKLKLTLEDTIQPNDTEEIVDGLHFIIDQGHVHYFNNKKIDFILDKHGFKEFEEI